MNSEIVAALTVEHVGYRAFDAARSFVAAMPSSGQLSPVEFAAAFERWINEPVGTVPAQLLAPGDKPVLIKRPRGALIR
jgi:hypothetical protein